MFGKLEFISAVFCIIELVNEVPKSLGIAIAEDPIEAIYQILQSLYLREDYF
jgi:hypothetical protein